MGMKLRLRLRRLHLVRGTCLAALAVLVLLEVAGEAGLLGASIETRLRARLQDHGLDAAMRRVRVGLFSGVRVEGLVIRDLKSPGQVLADVDAVQLTPAWSSMLGLEFHPKACRLYNGTATLALDLPERDKPLDITLNHIDVQMVWSDRGVWLRHAGATLNGLSIKLRGHIHGFPTSAAVPGETNEAVGASWNWNRRLSKRLDTAPQALVRTLEFLADNTFPEASSGIQADLNLGLADQISVRAGGTIHLADVAFEGRPIRKVKGAFDVSPTQFRVHALQVFLGEESILTGDLAVALPSGQVDANLALRARPDTVLAMVPPGLAPTLSRLSGSAVAEAKVRVAGKSAAWDELEAEFQLTVPNLRYGGLPIRLLSVAGRKTPNCLSVDAVHAVLGHGAGQQLAGTVGIPARDGWLATLKGTLRPLQLIADLGFELPQALADSPAATLPARVSLWIDEAESVGTAPTLAGEVAWDEFPFGDLTLRGLTCVWEYREGTLEVKRLTASVPEEMTIEASASLDGTRKRVSADLTATGRLCALGDALPEHLRTWTERFRDSRGTLAVKLFDSPWDAARWRGQARVALSRLALYDAALGQAAAVVTLDARDVRLRSLELQGDDGQTVSANGYYNRILQRFGGRIEGRLNSDLARVFLPDEAGTSRLVDLAFRGLCFEIDVIPDPDNPLSWNAAGTFSVGPGVYRGLEFAEIAKSTFTFRPALTPLQSHALHLEVPLARLDPKRSMRNGVVDVRFGKDLSVSVQAQGTTPPTFARVFVAGDRYRRRFDRIFRDFVWDPETPPTIDLRELVYYDNPEDNSWFFKLAGSIDAPNAGYRGIEAERIAADVLIDLPNQVIIRNIEIEMDPVQQAEGKVVFHLGGEHETCDISCDGTFDPWVAIAAAAPDWASGRDTVSFSPASELTFEGTVPLQAAAELTLRGTIRTPRIDLAGMPLQQLHAAWDWTDRTVGFRDLECALLAGQLSGDLRFGTLTRAGTLDLDVERIDLQKLREARPSDSSFDARGHLSLHDLTLEFFPALTDDGVTRLNGNATLTLDDSDIWRIPFFSPLADRVPLLQRVVSLGEISNLSANLKFENELLHIHDFRTDGTILSLESVGPGTYNRRTEHTAMRLRGILLEKTGIIPFLTRPISRLFEAEIDGSASDAQWVVVKGVTESLGGDDPEEEPESVPQPEPVPATEIPAEPNPSSLQNSSPVESSTPQHATPRAPI